jgi:hypothetical protein
MRTDRDSQVATNAPPHWPPVQIEWNRADPGMNTLAVANELRRGFEGQEEAPQLGFCRNRLYVEGVLEVPIEVREGARRTAVFVYDQADEEAQAHFAAARALLHESEGAGAVYYAPAPLEPAPPVPAVQPLDTYFFSLPEDEHPEGEYALWWPTPDQPSFSGSPAMACLTRVYEALDGYGSLFFTAFVNELELVGKDRPANALVALPIEPLVQPVDGPGGLALRLLASAERGLAFAFATAQASAAQRDAFLKLFAEFAEWFRREAEEAHVPPRAEDQGPALAWWRARRDEAVRREAEGETDLRIGRILEVGSLRSRSDVSTAQERATVASAGRPNEVLADLVFDALTHGVGLVRVADADPAASAGAQPALQPFLWVREDERTYSTTFTFMNESEALAAAREALLEKSEARLAVLVCDGYLRVGEERVDALIARAHERGAPHSWVFAQRYQPLRGEQPFDLVGNPLLFQHDAPLFP